MNAAKLIKNWSTVYFRGSCSTEVPPFKPIYERILAAVTAHFKGSDGYVFSPRGLAADAGCSIEEVVELLDLLSGAPTYAIKKRFVFIDDENDESYDCEDPSTITEFYHPQTGDEIFFFHKHIHTCYLSDQFRPAVAPTDPWEGVDRRDGPMHQWFGLSYSSYLVLHRSLIQEMSIDWQKRLCLLLSEMEEEFDTDNIPNNFRVQLLDERNRFMKDLYADYRRGPVPPKAKK